jgi:hypothetical protein
LLLFIPVTDEADRIIAKVRAQLTPGKEAA